MNNGYVVYVNQAITTKYHESQSCYLATLDSFELEQSHLPYAIAENSQR